LQHAKYPASVLAIHSYAKVLTQLRRCHPDPDPELCEGEGEGSAVASTNCTAALLPIGHDTLRISKRIWSRLNERRLCASAHISRTVKRGRLITPGAHMSILAQTIVHIQSGAEYLFLAGCLLIVLKLVATVIHVSLSRGDYRSQPDTALFRVAYFAGKVTPAMAAGCLCMSALLGHDQKHSWEYGTAAIFAALFAALIVRLRKGGRFFGVLDMLSKRQKDR